MGAIAFTKDPQEGWVVAGWAFRQILDDTASWHPSDSELAEEFDKAKAISGLMVHSLPPEFAARVASALRETAAGVLSGSIRSGIADKPYGDDRTTEQYREALRQLIETIPSPDARGGRLARP
jgi:hypothetical protein